MKKNIRVRLISVGVVLALITALIPTFVVSVGAADLSTTNIFALDWSIEGKPVTNKAAEIDVEFLPGSPLTVRYSSSVSSYISLIFKFGEPVFLSADSYRISFFNNVVPGSDSQVAPKPSLKINLTGSYFNTTVVGSKQLGYSASFAAPAGVGTYTDFSIFLLLSVEADVEYYFTFLSCDPNTEGVKLSSPSDIAYSTKVYKDGILNSSFDGDSFYFDMLECGNSAKNPQYQKFMGDSTVRMYGGLDYNFFECSFTPSFSETAPDWLTSPAYGSYFYYDVSINMPGTLMYIDVHTSNGINIPYELCYFAADSIQSVDVGAGTLSQTMHGSTLVPIGGTIAGGLVAVQPSGSKNVNYVLSTNYNGTGTTGSLDYGIDYGYRDATYVDATTYEYDATSSFLSTSRLNLRFKIYAYSLRQTDIVIDFVCMDNLYVNYDLTYSTTGLLDYNSGTRNFSYFVQVRNGVDDALVSIDTSYLASKLDKNTDEVLAFLERFYPSSKSIVEFNSTVGNLNSAAGTIDGYERAYQQSAAESFSKLPSFQSGTCNYLDAMLFVSGIVDVTVNSMDTVSGIIVIPILLGLFFFILQRVSGVTRIGRHSGSDQSGKGGDGG